MRVRLLVIGCLIVGSLSPVASSHPRPPKHSETQTYLVPSGITTSHEDSYPTGPAKDLAPPLEFMPKATDRFVTFEAADLTGRPVILEIHQDASAPGGTALNGYMCQSATPTAYALVSDAPVEVRVLHGACRNHNWGWATQGTVTATFSSSDPGHLGGPGRDHH